MVRSVSVVLGGFLALWCASLDAQQWIDWQLVTGSNLVATPALWRARQRDARASRDRRGIVSACRRTVDINDEINKKWKNDRLQKSKK